MKIFYFDLETTGLSHKENGIHQIAGMIEINGELVEEFDFKVRPHPGCKISKTALEIGGVDYEDIINYPTIGEVYTKLTSMLSKYVNKFDRTNKFHLCGYNNAAFDNQFFREWFLHCGDKYFGSWFFSSSLDVMVLAADHLKEVRHTMENFKLGTVAEFMGIDVIEESLHDGLYDVRLTRDIYLRLREERGVRIVPSAAFRNPGKFENPGKSGSHGILL